jgi:hypothetical protein
MPSFVPVSGAPVSALPVVATATVTTTGGGADLGAPYGLPWLKRKKKRHAQIQAHDTGPPCPPGKGGPDSPAECP